MSNFAQTRLALRHQYPSSPMAIGIAVTESKGLPPAIGGKRDALKTGSGPFMFKVPQAHVLAKRAARPHKADQRLSLCKL